MSSISIICHVSNSTLPFTFGLCGKFSTDGTHVRISHQQTSQANAVLDGFFAVPTSGTEDWATTVTLAAGDGASVTVSANLYTSNAAGATPVAVAGPVTYSLDANALPPACSCVDTTEEVIPGGLGAVGT